MVGGQAGIRPGQGTQGTRGLTNDDGGPITLPDRPGKKITLMSGIAAWQRDLKEYGVNQGFTIK